MNTVIEPLTCPDCDNTEWYMGYEETGESVYECTECGFVGCP